MRRLLCFTCLTPLSLPLLPGPATAQTVISSRVTTPVATATAANGQPANVRIATNGTVAPAGGAAVTVDSNHTLTNEGAIEMRGANGATAILVQPGVATAISHSGRIVVDEDFTPADADNDGDLDGPFAQGNGRFGIRLAPGGAVTGNVTSSGAITIEGNASAAIAADSRLIGSLTSSGAIGVIGNDGFGIRAGDITGSVRVTGVVDVRGANTVGIALDGDVGGAFTLQSAVAATGYRAVARPADTSKLDADDLLQGGPAVRIAGNIAGGILFDAPPPDASATDPDEDDDGIDDVREGTASASSFGSAPAVVIGAADRAVTIGAIAGQANGHGFVNRGTIAADGVYAGVAATALQIGGRGGAATIAGGITNANRIGATSFGGDATALRLGAQATVPELRNSGTIAASGAGSAGRIARAIAIDADATMTAVRNSGVIEARATAAAGAATAIEDRGGRLTLIENSGRIDATGADPARAIAIDLRQNGSGATVRQTSAGGTNPPVPRIRGAVRFGAGGDRLDLAAGSLEGDVEFGGGDNRLALANAASLAGAARFGAGADQLTVEGSASLTGALDFGGGADRLSIAGTGRVRGALSNAGGATISVSAGALEITNTGPIAIAALDVGATGTLGVALDARTGQASLLNVAGTARFASGSRLQIGITEIGQAEGRFTVLRAGTLQGVPVLATDQVLLPFLFQGALASDAAPGEIAVQIRRKTAAELGLNRSEASAYPAAYALLLADAPIGNAFLAINEGAAFRRALGSLLPDHAGGVFETATQGSRATARFLADPRAPLVDMGRWGFWLQQSVWGTDKARGQTASYDLRGWGFSGGAELLTGAGNFGVSLAYLDSESRQDETSNEVAVSHYELGLYWRGSFGGLRGWVRASAALLNMDSSRLFAGTAAGNPVRRINGGSWDGQLYSGAAGLLYEAKLGRRLALRPAVSIDYYRLSEDGYAESGGGATALTVRGRTGDELAGTASATLGYLLGREDAGWLRIELEGGRRQILGGSLGDTVARFGQGPEFRLAAEERTDGWLGRLRLIGGNPGFTLGGEASAEEQQGRAALAFRVSLQIGM